MRILCLLALLCAYGFGQGFQELATNRDGSVLYFSTALRQRGSPQYFHPKIFRWDRVKSVALYEQRPPDVPFPTPFPLQNFQGSQFFSLVTPDVSSDGSTVAVTGIRLCNFSDICVVQIEEYQSTIYTAGKPTIAAAGTAILSPNGRYALLRSSATGVLGSANMSLLDLQTGQQTGYLGAWQPLGGKRQVANDGTVVLAAMGGFAIGRAGQMKTVPVPVAANPLINDSGALVIYQAAGASPGTARLAAYSTATGASTDLITEAAGTPNFRPSISEDGRLIAFLSGPNRQISVIRSDGSGLQQIASFPEPVTEVALSGDGSVAFAVTAVNRIVRIDIPNAQSTDIVPATPYTNVPSANGFQNSFVQGYRFMVSRGATTTITGSGFAAMAQAADPPYPPSLGGVELRVGGIAVPIAGVSPMSISIPATWDLPADAPVDVEVWIASASASPFVPGFEIEPVRPSFYGATGPPPNLIAAHQNFQSQVSADNPAQPGEYVHVYAKDLGPVLPAPPAGLPAPFQPISELAVPISCTFGQDLNPNPGSVEVAFAGLAPGLQNVFQIDVHLPQSFQGSPSRLRCQVSYPSLGYVIAGFLAVPP